MLIMALTLSAGDAIGAPAGRSMHFRLDTTKWKHYPGYLVFTYMISVPSAVPLAEENRIRVRNLVSDGQMGQDDSAGGVSGGKSFACIAPTSFEWVIDPDEVPDILCKEPPCRYSYTELPVNFTKRYALDADAVWLGSYIEFDLELPALGYTDPKLPLDQLSICFLTKDMLPGFSTADTLGADALVTCSPRRSGTGWQLEVFEPARAFAGEDGTIDSIVVVLPEPPLIAGDKVAPLHLSPGIKKAGREYEGSLWIEYLIPMPADHVLLRVFDSNGREVTRREVHGMRPGYYGHRWPDRGEGKPPPAGNYRVVLEVDAERFEQEAVLD